MVKASFDKYQNNLLLTIIEYTIYIIPISFVLGSLVVNFNIFIFLILGFFYFFKKKINLEFNNVNILLLLFFLIIIYSSYRNYMVIGKEDFIKSIFVMKFYLFYLILENLLAKTNINLKPFFIINFFLIIFVSTDLTLQFFTGKNLLGYEPWGGRITGIFGDEAIAGAYIQKLFLISLCSLFFLISKIKKNYEVFFTTSFLIITFFSVFIASNRMSLILFSSTIIILFIVYRKLRKSIIFALIILIPIFNHLYKSDEQTYLKISNLGYELKKISFINFNKKNNADKQIEIISDNKKIKSNHEKLFFTAFLSFKEKKFFGNGYKSFRHKCFLYEKNVNTLCSTHPHNYHLEVLHDFGLIGYFTLSLFVFSLIFETIKKIKKNSFNDSYKFIIYFLLLNLLIEIFPLKSSGSLFTTWNGTILWTSIALINYKKNN